MPDLVVESAPKVAVRLAKSGDEVIAAQKLRYTIFYEEYKAKATDTIKSERRDFDRYDDVAQHLVAIDSTIDSDKPEDRIIGTYRLINEAGAKACGQFYSSDEYDLTPLLQSGKSLLELGRSCILPAYRTRPVLQLLWQAIANYVMDHNIDIMFGCASLHGTDIEALAAPLSYLYHNHTAPKDLCPRAVDGRYVDMNLIAKDDLPAREAFKNLPPLIKGYIRAGANIGDGAVIDHQFNTTDVCIVMPTTQLAERYRNHYERKNGRSFSSPIKERAPRETV